MTSTPYHVNAGLDVRATIQCLTGCGVGEVVGMVLGTALGWSNAPTVFLAIVLAFVFGYVLTVRALWVEGIDDPSALWLAVAVGTPSIALGEIVANAGMLSLPGAMDTPLTSLYFWASLALSLVIAGAVAFPVNLWLMRSGLKQPYAHGRSVEFDEDR